MANECDDIERFKNFVEGFSLNVLPVKPSFPHRRRQSPPVKWNEVEGECLDLAMNCLKKSKCPLTLSFAIARSATNKVLQSDLDQFASVDKNSGTKAYSSKVLEEIVRKSIEEVCVNWTVDFPTLKYEKSPVISDCGIQNLRRKMEDKHNVLCNVNLLDDISDLPTLQLYSIFDGHAGVEAAAYASKQLHLRFIRNSHFPSDIPLCLKSVLKEIDDAFCEKANSEKIRSGCTALVVVVYESIFHLAWIGDSQAVIVKDGVAIELMEPHKPEREDERQRIEEAGGVVVNFGSWRVNGNLSVSRAIGDPDFKPYVCADADVISRVLDGDDDYFCLACDGFWDVYEAHDLPQLVAEHMTSGGKREDVSEYLCRKASEKGSQDNITVIVVFLRDGINLKRPLQGNDAANSVTTDETAKASGSAVSARQALSGVGLITLKFALPQHNESGKAKKSNEVSETVKERADGVISFDRSTTNNNDDGTKLDTIITGSKVLPCAKEKIPHRLLVNYVRSNVPAHKADKVVVTESHPHLKMPSSLYKAQKKSSPSRYHMRRQGSSDTLLSLTTVKSCPNKLLPSPDKVHRSAPQSFQLPNQYAVISDYRKVENDSNASLPVTFLDKPLGYRAQQPMFRRGPLKQVYRTSTVQANINNKRSQFCSLRAHQQQRGSSNKTQRNTIMPSTEIAITNSLQSKLKPLKQQTSSSVSSNGKAAVKVGSLTTLLS